MNRLRNFLTGNNNADYDNNNNDNTNNDGYPIDSSSSSSNNHHQTTSWNSRYGYNNNNNNNRNNHKQQSRHHDDDLYLSDDDDWGMSSSSSAFNASSPSQQLREMDRYDYSSSNRRSSSAFWDQSSMNEDGGAGGGGEGGHNNNSNRGGLQEWEREAIHRDNLNADFEIGNDDYYHSEVQQSSSSSSPSPSSSSKHDAYYDVREDIRTLEGGAAAGAAAGAAEEDDVDNDHDDDDDDDTNSAASSKQEEVVNAYRDYLKSIRDGGFESYLDTDQTPDFDGDHPHRDATMEDNNHNETNTSSTMESSAGSSSAGRAYDEEDHHLERTLDIEEERASGSLYGDLYGVQDMRASSSPYNAWRAKAKALLQAEQERERNNDSPSRQILKRFRKNRHHHHPNNHQIHNAAHKYGRTGGPDDNNNDRYYNHLFRWDLQKLYHYRIALFRNQRFRGACIAICLILALAAGFSYYGDKKNARYEAQRGSGGGGNEDLLAIPPKEGNAGAASTTSSSESSSNSNSQSNTINNGNNNPQTADRAGPSDAVVNALGTFDPIWYDRRSGWEGITFADAVNFCSSHQGRVPCPYEIYCNQEASGAPYRGARPNGEQWSPISNGANQWVSVGDMFTCRRYTELHDGKKPDWGISGISLEHEHGAGGITQNIMCCVDLYNIGTLDPFTEWGKQGPNGGGGGGGEDTVEGDNAQETTTSAAVNVADAPNEKNPNEGNAATLDSSTTANLDAQKREKAVISAFQPIWFSNAHGWSGTSYEDAIQFCESYNHMVLCPYAAYCPNGNGRPPLPGSMINELDGEEWVPANGPMNTWLQIGRVEGNPNTQCTLHHELLGQRPEWGIDGTRTEVKHHIMCCMM